MLNFYEITIQVYRDGKPYGDVFICENLTKEIKPPESTTVVTWDNINEIMGKLGLFLPFYVWYFKRGRLIKSFSFKPFDKSTWAIKEWKSPETGLIIHEIYTIKEPTMKQLQKYGVKTVTLYLKERGLA